MVLSNCSLLSPYPHFLHLFCNKCHPKWSCLHPIMCPIPLRSWGAPDSLSHRPVLLGFPAGLLGLLTVLGQLWGWVGRGSFLWLSCGGFSPCQVPPCMGWCSPLTGLGGARAGWFTVPHLLLYLYSLLRLQMGYVSHSLKLRSLYFWDLLALSRNKNKEAGEQAQGATQIHTSVLAVHSTKLQSKLFCMLELQD